MFKVWKIFFSSTQETARTARQNMENASKDFVNAKTAGKALLVNRKVRVVLQIANDWSSCFHTFVKGTLRVIQELQHCSKSRELARPRNEAPAGYQPYFNGFATWDFHFLFNLDPTTCSVTTMIRFHHFFHCIAATCYNVNNCTSPINGICQRTDQCRCHEGFIGK